MLKIYFRKIVRLILKIGFGFVLFTVVWVALYGLVNPPISGMMVYKTLTQYNYSYEREWVELEEISPQLSLAFIAAEDQSFFDHHGLDWQAIQNANADNRKSNRLRGGSTISQQLAKNLFLIPSKSYFRKGLEVYFTFLMELFYSKCRIMELYLNMVELGPGVYGVEQASQQYFRLSASQIGLDQACLMASALPNPNLFLIENPTKYMRKRQNWIKRQSQNLGGIAFFQNQCP